YEFEILFTDNHSTDGTFNILERLSLRDPRIRIIRFSRNFGFQRSIFTAYANARGEAAVQIDCDLQDPPSLIFDFVRMWEDGYRVVYGIRGSRKEGALMNFVRTIFYRVIDSPGEVEAPLEVRGVRSV